MELYVDANLRAFDLSIEHRKEINDTITLQATQALEEVVLEKYHLKRTWMSPNGAIRSALGGDVSRKPMVYRHIPPLVKQWRRPIIIARHAFSDQYNSQDFMVPGPGTLQIKYSPTMGASYNIHIWQHILEEHNAVHSSLPNQQRLQLSHADTCRPSQLAALSSNQQRSIAGSNFAYRHP
ncbi:isocitrate dehydrogenase [NADP] cytoplasmic-like [Dermacentor silvarum]|uniref:isocitrate dehydrogenase [NADP] cytoplasmic-like n=1 Tax=Dermacentor silvarum TaxID=543639 RepID=UPI00189BD57A|nr:isocitrate dehydrogenase [NADP] cytoplasmic-like [Dermacentor silvarum]